MDNGIRDKAKKDYLNGMSYKDICKKYNIPMNTLKSWVKRYKWAEEKKKHKAEGAHKDKRGAPKGNKYALGNNGGAPIGNLNSLKHGAYQSIYFDMLEPEEKVLYNMMPSSTNIDAEIKILRLKIARLLNIKKSFFYTMFGQKINKDVSEEDRISGINACMDQLRRLIEKKARMANDTERLELEKEKFEFNKYKADVETQINKERLQLEKIKVRGEDEEDFEDDGFLDALKGKVPEVWDDKDED